MKYPNILKHIWGVTLGSDVTTKNSHLCILWTHFYLYSSFPLSASGDDLNIFIMDYAQSTLKFSSTIF